MGVWMGRNDMKSLWTLFSTLSFPRINFNKVWNPGLLHFSFLFHYIIYSGFMSRGPARGTARGSVRGSA